MKIYKIIVVKKNKITKKQDFALRLDPEIKKRKNKKMSKQGQENLPSITTRKIDAGGERYSVNKEKDTA